MVLNGVVVYGWGDCLNNKLANGIVSTETKEKTSGGSSVVDAMLLPTPPTWTRPKKVTALTTASLSKLAESLVSEDEEVRSNGPTIITGVACGAHNSAFIAVGGAFGDFGAAFMSGAGLSAHGSSLLCDHHPEVPKSSKDGTSAASTGANEDGRMKHSPLNVPVVLPRPGPLATQTVTQISLGNYHAALATRTGQAYTWGWGAFGQLGHGDGNSKAEPTHVLSLYAVHQIECGTKFTAAVTLFGELYVFGENEQGQLGIGNTQRQLSPVQCKRLAAYSVTHISCGASHMAAVSLDSLEGIGAKSSSSFPNSNTPGFPSPFGGYGGANNGDPSYSSSSSISSVAGADDAATGAEPAYLSLASFNSATAGRPCAGVASRVWTWGQSSTSGKVETLPREIVSLRGLGITMVACGEMHSLALSSLGQVLEWKVGEIPVHVGGALQGHVVRSIDAGAYHSLALTSSGKLFSWGRSKTGQLGRTDNGDPSKPGLITFEKKSSKGGDDDSSGNPRTKLKSSTSAVPLLSSMPSTPTKPSVSTPTSPTSVATPTSPSRAPPKGPPPAAPGAVPAANVTPSPSSARDTTPKKDKPTRSATSVPSPGGSGSTSTSNQFIARISAGEYHNIAIVERDPRRLLLWKILKRERKFLLRLHVIVDMYLATMSRLTEEESSAPSSSDHPDWQRILGEWAVVGTPHAIAFSNSANHAAYKQYHVMAANTSGQLATSSDSLPTFPINQRGSHTGSPRHASQSNSSSSAGGGSNSSSSASSAGGGSGGSSGAGLSHSTSQNSLSSKSAGSKRDTVGTSAMENFRQYVGESDFKQVLQSVFGNISSIYRVHSQFVQELGKVIEESHGLGSDAAAAVEAVLTLWRFRLSFFSLYAVYADQYTAGAYHLFVLAKVFPHVSSTLKAVQELANQRFAKTSGPPPDFSLKNLLLEPLRHVALETQLLRQLQDMCIQPTKVRRALAAAASLPSTETQPYLGASSDSPRDTSTEPAKARPTHKAPAPPGGAPAQVTRRPSLSTRPAPPSEALPSALSHSQFSWHAPYLIATSSVVSLDETLSHMSGLLERVCKNFNFVDASEILTATMDERGFPQISGGSVELLVKRLTHHSFTDNEFVNAFLLTYRMFISPIQFLNLLIQRYHNTFPPGLDEREKDAYNKLVRFPIQSRVVQVLVQWLQSPLSSYDWNPKALGGTLDENQKALHAALTQFCTTVLQLDEEWKPHALLMTGLLKIASKTSAMGGAGGPKLIPVGPNAAATTSDAIGVAAPLPSSAALMINSPLSATAQALVADIHSVVHFENSIKTLANTIASQNMAILREVSAKEFLNQSWMRKEQFSSLAPGVFALTQRFNFLASWASYEIVNPENLKDRTTAIAIIAQLASSLFQLRDYNGFVALMSGLNNSSVSRLKKSFAKLSSKQTQLIEQMEAWASPKDNYRALRQLWLVAQPPAVPFLALTLKDLTFIEDGNPDKLDDGSTNFYKYRKMAEVVSLCLSTRDVVPSLKPDTTFDSYLKKLSPIVAELGDDGMYKLSKKRE